MKGNNTNNLYVQAKKLTTHKQHCFGEGDYSLCGVVHINDCEDLKMVGVTKRLYLYLWPHNDLNFCGRCRISLNAKGVI